MDTLPDIPGLPEIPPETSSARDLDPQIASMDPEHPIRKQAERDRDAKAPLEERLEVVPFFFVVARDADGVPHKVGNLYDMGPGKVGKSFPRFAPLCGFLSEDEAEQLRRRLVDYVKDVKAIPQHKRPGSAKFW